MIHGIIHTVKSQFVVIKQVMIGKIVKYKKCDSI